MKVRDLIAKDLILMIKDKKAMVLMLIMPIILITILGFALTDSFNEMKSTNKIDVAVVKQYNIESEEEKFREFMFGNLSKYEISNDQFTDSNWRIDIEEIFFDEFLNNKKIKEIINYKIMDMEEGKTKLKNKDVSAVIILPENFIYDMYINLITPFRNEINISVYGHPDKNISSQIVEEVVKGFSNTISTSIIGKNIYLETAMEQEIGNIAYDRLEDVLKDLIKENESFNSEIKYEKLNERKPMTSSAYYSFGMSSMFILFAAGYGSRLLLEEKQNKTYDRMTVGGVEKTKIVLGKIATIFIYTMIQFIIIIMYSSILLKVNWGNYLLVFVICSFSAFAVAGLSIFLASIVYMTGNYKLASFFESAVVNIMALIGGSTIPIQVLPKSIQKVGKFTLNGIAMNSFKKVYFGYTLEDIYVNLITLAIIGVIFIYMASLVLKMEGRRGKDEKYYKFKANGNA